MGACVSTQPTSPQQLNLQMKRLKHQINSTIQKLRGQALTQQKILIGQFKKQKSYRAAAAQMAIASQITMKANKMQIYEVVRCHVQKLIDYNHHLQKPQKAKQSLYPSFKQILYCQSILKDQNIDNFCKAIRKRFPDIAQAVDSDIDSQIIKHHKKNQLPSQTMINQYLLKLINQENLNIQDVNKVGHKIRYGG